MESTCRAAQEGRRVHHMDIKSAFLNGNLKKDVYVCQHRALYGQCQAPCAWNAKLDTILKDMGFEQSEHEVPMYQWGRGRSVLLVNVYVDGLVIIDAEEEEVVALKVKMKSTFNMSDPSLLCFYLDIVVHHWQHRHHRSPIALREAHHGAGQARWLESNSHPQRRSG